MEPLDLQSYYDISRVDKKSLVYLTAICPYLHKQPTNNPPELIELTPELDSKCVQE